MTELKTPAEGMPKPSGIDLNHVPPLVGTLRRAEAEALAALIVRALQVNGDEWRPIAWAEVVKVFGADVAADRQPWARLSRNPFFRPGLSALVKEHMDEHGAPYRFAEHLGEPEGLVQFTPRGISAMAARWQIAAPAADRTQKPTIQ